MESDKIIEIGIDGEERLYVKPETLKFPMIYREAMEVHWNQGAEFLYSPKPRKWTHLDWYKQIIAAAKEQGCELKITDKTNWINVSPELQKEIASC